MSKPCLSYFSFIRRLTKATFWGLPVSERELMAITGSVAAAGRHGTGAVVATTVIRQRELPGNGVGL